MIAGLKYHERKIHKEQQQLVSSVKRITKNREDEISTIPEVEYKESAK